MTKLMMSEELIAQTDASEMLILDGTGHTKIKWDPSKPAEVTAARAVFDEMTKKGYRAFTPGKNGSQVDQFDPELEALVLVPHLVGG